MKRFLINVLELFGVVFLRFRLLPRIWCVWLVGVNLVCLLFITRIEGQVVLAVTCAAVLAQALVYGRLGFTRVLGLAHVLWLPMFVWMAFRWGTISADPNLARWLTVLLVTNAISLMIDATDVLRFIKGERAPHYAWRSIPA